MSIGDAVNYVLFNNPVSSSLGSVVSSAAKAVGITPKSNPASSVASLSPNQIITKNLPLYRLAGCHHHFVRLAGLSGATAVILGAYGAHMKFLTSDEKGRDARNIFETANRYHLIHSIALLGVPLTRRPIITGSLLASGMMLFCGVCYHASLKNDHRFSKLAPVGGFLLIIGWLSMIF